MSSGEGRKSSLMISQYWFESWLGAVRQQASTWTNVNWALYRHIASLAHNEFTYSRQRTLYVVIIGLDKDLLFISLSTTMTSQWARWSLKSSALRLFTQPFIQVQIKENMKVPRNRPLWGEFTGDRWILLTEGQERWKCFHLRTSSWPKIFLLQRISLIPENIVENLIHKRLTRLCMIGE